nr:hypothetical protein GCM10020241_53040 [Streptoalloteichus tenebrarius]
MPDPTRTSPITTSLTTTSPTLTDPVPERAVPRRPDPAPPDPTVAAGTTAHTVPRAAIARPMPLPAGRGPPTPPRAGRAVDPRRPARPPVGNTRARGTRTPRRRGHPVPDAVAPARAAPNGRGPTGTPTADPNRRPRIGPFRRFPSGNP